MTSSTFDGRANDSWSYVILVSTVRLLECSYDEKNLFATTISCVN